MRKKIVAGNWKMNKNLHETLELVQDLKNSLVANDVEVMIAPTFVSLAAAKTVVQGTAIEVIAQNMHAASNGAFTGEISGDMLKSVGVETVILGHSERRAYFGETDAILAEKVKSALNQGFRIVFCFGEELHDRKSGQQNEIVKSQLETALFDLPAASWSRIVLAYEPVWAIGTGETASPEQAQEMHAFIRTTIANHYDKTLAEGVSILYGGSVKPNNAHEIFGKPDVDGGLIGGAALLATDFLAIVAANQ